MKAALAVNIISILANLIAVHNTTRSEMVIAHTLAIVVCFGMAVFHSERIRRSQIERFVEPTAREQIWYETHGWANDEPEPQITSGVWTSAMVFDRLVHMRDFDVRDVSRRRTPRRPTRPSPTRPTH